MRGGALTHTAFNSGSWNICGARARATQSIEQCCLAGVGLTQQRRARRTLGGVHPFQFNIFRLLGSHRRVSQKLGWRLIRTIRRVFVQLQQCMALRLCTLSIHMIHEFPWREEGIGRLRPRWSTSRRQSTLVVRAIIASMEFGFHCLVHCLRVLRKEQPSCCSV